MEDDNGGARASFITCCACKCYYRWPSHSMTVMRQDAVLASQQLLNRFAAMRAYMQARTA
jgi:hypothetical protein